MTNQPVRFYTPPDGTVRHLVIETTGAVVDITVGLADAEGRAVTAVDITPDGEQRGGDAHGRVWDLNEDGRRVVRRADPRHDDAADAAKAAAEAAKGGATQEHWTLVVTGELDDGDREHISMAIARGETSGRYTYGYSTDEEI